MHNAEFFHNLAMEAADRGFALRKAGSEEAARREFRCARIFEAGATTFITTQPWHAILCRSAGQLALDAGEPREAEVLAQVGLAGEGVPAKYAAELWEVLAEAQKQIQAEAAKARNK